MCRADKPGADGFHRHAHMRAAQVQCTVGGRSGANDGHGDPLDRAEVHHSPHFGQGGDFRDFHGNLAIGSAGDAGRGGGVVGQQGGSHEPYQGSAGAGQERSARRASGCMLIAHVPSLLHCR